jgi:hypothetical protein
VRPKFCPAAMDYMRLEYPFRCGTSVSEQLVVLSKYFAGVVWWWAGIAVTGPNANKSCEHK